MSRTERRLKQESIKKRSRVKWILLLAFIGSALLFYMQGPELLGVFFSREPTMEKYTLVYRGKLHEVAVEQVQGVHFLEAKWVARHLMPEMLIDPETGKARWNTFSRPIQFDDPALSEKVVGTDFPLEINLMKKEEKWLFPVSGTENFLPYTSQWYPETGVLVLNDRQEPHGVAHIKDAETSLRAGPGRLDPVIQTLSSGTKVTMIQGEEDPALVLTENGQLGYVTASRIGEVAFSRQNSSPPVWPLASPGELPTPFGLVWDYVGHSHPDRSSESSLQAISVFSPTWFELKDPEGHLENRAQFRYAQTMKQRGYQLWGLVSNAFDPDMTESFLKNEQARRRLISQLSVYASLYELDGINIDFENIHFRNRDLLTDFVRDLSEVLRQQNLIVSMDVTVPGGSPNWSLVYDREALAPHLDYLAVMTYDEHWASSPVAGSVASYPWVEEGIRATLEVVPPEKILLGLPLYTRLWEESRQENGHIHVSSRAMGMSLIRETLRDHQVEPEDWKWLEDEGQYYAEYETGDQRYRVWLEDEHSLALKAGLIEKYDLAGFAAWRKDFEIPRIWDRLEEEMAPMRNRRK